MTTVRTVTLTDAQIANLRTACFTSTMRDEGNWRRELELLAIVLWEAMDDKALTPPNTETAFA